MGLGINEDGSYKWAVIIGGQPDEFGADGLCTTSETDINNSGLWFFSRSQIADSAEIEEMMEVLRNQGVSATKLKNVVQEGCNYDGAVIKQN